MPSRCAITKRQETPAQKVIATTEDPVYRSLTASENFRMIELAILLFLSYHILSGEKVRTTFVIPGVRCLLDCFPG